MMKLIFLGLCLVAGASAIVPWASNPILPGYPVFFLSWGPGYCSTITTDEKQCFDDCMNANNMGQYISIANSDVPICPPTLPGCNIPWRQTACQCSKRCDCKLIGRCLTASCPFCRQ